MPIPLHNPPPRGTPEWFNLIENEIRSLQTDMTRVIRRQLQNPDIGIPMTGGDSPVIPVFPFTGSGSNPATWEFAEGILTSTLANSTGSGATAATATLDVYQVTGGVWGSISQPITVTNRSDHLWLPIGHPLQVQNVNGEVRPRFLYSPPYRATLTSSLAAGGSATANLLKVTGAGIYGTYSPNISITVYPDLALGTNTIASGKGVSLKFVGGYFWVIGADC